MPDCLLPATGRNSNKRGTLRRMAVVLFLAGMTAPGFAAGEGPVGQSTGLPLPRFVSLKYNEANLREGPSTDHRTTWIYQRAGLPVEVTAEFDVWRRVRDSEGTEGWVQQTLLSGRRTALVEPWKKGDVLNLHAEPAENSALTARLQAGVQVNVKSCDGKWCRVSGDDFDGYIAQSGLWGVYPNEKL
jgi:SH3-like domain-containing protein